MPLTRREQMLVARIVRQRLEAAQIEPLLAQLPPARRSAVIDAIGAVNRWSVPRRRRGSTIRGGPHGR